MNLMKKIFSVFVLGLLIATAGCGGSLNSGKTLVDINGTKITEGYLDFLSTINPNIAAQLSTPFGKKQILDSMVEQELLYQASKKGGLAGKPEVKAKLDLYNKLVLAQSFIEASAEKEGKKYYDEHKNEFERLKMSHIMIRFATPEELKASKKTKNPNMAKHNEQQALALANQIADKVSKGENFAKAAKEYSEDMMTKEQGGDLGFISKEDPRLTRRGFQPLIEKAFTMKVGETAGPIKTTEGYHILTLTQPAEQAPFAEIKNQILFKTRGDMRNKILGELKEKGKVVFAAEFATPPAPPTPAAAQPAPEKAKPQ